jgi:Flp pilus assembly protein TadD
MNRLFVLIVGLIAVVQITGAQTADEQYVRIYNLIQQADALRTSGAAQEALPKYLEAQTALTQIQRINPLWNPKVVSYRLNYLATRIAEIPGAQLPPTTGTPDKQPPVSSAASRAAVVAGSAPNTEAGQQLAGLQEAVKQLQAEKMILEAKLKEALATQPAVIDPRELAKAQEKVQALLKENELLKAGLEQEKNRPAAVSAKELEEAKRLLAETNARLMAQQASNEKLTAEKTALQEQLGKAATNVEVAAALRAENELLKKQLTEAKAAATATDSEKASATAKKLAEAEARIATMASDAEVLRLEKLALEARLKNGPTNLVKSAIVPRDGAAAQIKELERQRDELYKILERRDRESGDGRNRELTAKVEQLTREVATLKSRVEVFEARAIPYSAEELALFQQSKPKPAPVPEKIESKAADGRKTVRELPQGTVALVAQAEKFFQAKQYDKAEENYLEILRQDENNAYTLANLGAIQLELGRLNEAETNIVRALAISPDDAHASSLLGYLKFRQQKYDDAVVALNRAAKLNPQNADIQNYLGVTLSQKGLRGPAEQAFRKAVVIDPNHAGAQNNLAVFYASENPPNVALARFHYQKALTVGHPRNPELEKLFEKKEAAARETAKP